MACLFTLAEARPPNSMAAVRDRLASGRSVPPELHKLTTCSILAPRGAAPLVPFGVPSPLDSFAKDNLDWGLKPGQSTLAGSIAVIRETLEDSLWISIDEK